MKLEAVLALSLLAVANAHAGSEHGTYGRHAHLAHKRQNNAAAAGSSVAPASVAAATPTATPAPAATGPNGVPALSAISSGMPTGADLPASTIYPPGATPSIAGAPPLPSAFVFNINDWPAQDVIPPTDSPDVTQWLTELEGFDIPDIAPTVDGSCIGDPAAAADAENRGWWTCGGWTGPGEITVCPDKLTWGVSFDDGPGPRTEQLLEYLNQEKLQATFFVVGSRCIERPNVLIEEYMTGHEISVHTWSHHPLTAMTNEQVVAELGWTRKIIKEITGVTPTTFRAPYGDIDNRVRAIANAMGLRSIIWSRSPSGFAFDTNDWRVAAGTVNSTDQMAIFETILNNATTMDTGFIVLEHDLYEITVDLAIGYTLNAAVTHNPPFSLKRIGDCNHMPITDMYLETNTNKSFPLPHTAVVSNSSGSAGSGSSGLSSGKSGSGAAGSAQTGGATQSYAIPSLAAFAAGICALLSSFML